ncbi:MAG TPA: NAD(P)-dependent alcohol dehydrogenase, partial [Candidatus Limnocylindria bacterium]|nr:NAD(P)-dependent alcohol dehydrogenase [Candidatus Limnocylindria bacterium]
MKEAYRDRYGSPDVVQVRDVPKPEPGEGEVLVRVRAASVNRADLDGLGPKPGFLRPFLGMRAPRDHRMGWDVAGEVESIGPGATRFKPGDAVFADLASHGGGSFAEFVAKPEKAFEPIPAGLSFEEASSLPHSAILALQGLRTRKGRTVQPGEKVLVVGASGNVGPFAVQIAKDLGAEVTAVCRTAKMDFVRSLGVDDVIDYQQADYTRSGRKWDWILDTDLRHSVFANRQVLRAGGRFISLGGDTGGILQGIVVGPLSSLFSDRWTGLMLWWKPFNRPDVDRL